MLDYEVALAQLLAETTEKDETQWLPITEACGYVLAEDFVAQHDVPFFDNSAMDGYAVCDSTGACTAFRLITRIPAGTDVTGLRLQQGEAARIFTGAPVPLNTTAVVMQEHVTLQPNGDLLLDKPVKPGANIRYQGEEIRKGTVLLKKRTLLDPVAVGLCASQGVSRVSVRKRLSVIVFSTGNELLEPGDTLQSGKIYDANRYQLQALLQQNYCVFDGGILADSFDVTSNALEQAARQYDVIIISGGASVGDEDYVKQAICTLGTLTAWKLAIKPGKPFGWGSIGACRLFMLPGNPVAAYVTYSVLVAPVLAKISGRTAVLPSLNAQANFIKEKPEERRVFLRGTYHQNEQGICVAEILALQGSAMLSGVQQANCLIEVLPDCTITVGSQVRIFPLIK